MNRTLYVIGGGAVGTSLGKALQRTGWCIVGVCEPDTSRQHTVSKLFGAPVQTTLGETVERASAVMVAVPDSTIEKVARDARETGVYGPEQVWFHVSGAHDASVLSPLEGGVLAVGAVHPAHVFAPGVVTTLGRGFSFAVDGDKAVMALAEEMASDLGARAVWVSGDQRKAYHAATVMASNCVAALLAESRHFMTVSGVCEQDAERLVVSLARSAVSYAEKVGVNASLSGPVRRGDADTVFRHLQALGHSERSLEVYRVLGRATVRLAEEIGMTDEEALRRIADLLDEGVANP
jgi:predicted short-subunit dehydrogenase-like oxidoreductase (DUF2520 family)